MKHRNRTVVPPLTFELAVEQSLRFQMNPAELWGK